MAADMLKNGLLKKEGDKLIVQLPVMKNEVYDKICEMLYNELKELAEAFADNISDDIEKMLLPYVRKDLMSNFIYWDMLMFFMLTGALVYYCWNDYLAQPDDYSKSAAGLYILR